jgi:Domain of unknown function (DUF4349)
MNADDPNDAALHDAFSARLEASPQPQTSMHARTMGLIDAPPAWRSYLAPATRWAAAAVVVIIGGAAIAQSFHRTASTAPAEQNVIVKADKLVPLPSIRSPIVRSVNMRILVNNVPIAFERLQVLAKRETAAPARKIAREGSIEATLTVAPERLAATIHSVATLGTVRSQSEHADDIGGALREQSNQVRVLTQEESALLANAPNDNSARLLDVRARLTLARAQLATLSRRVATATLHVTLSQS